MKILKLTFGVIFAFCLLSSFSFAQDYVSPGENKGVLPQGYLYEFKTPQEAFKLDLIIEGNWWEGKTPVEIISILKDLISQGKLDVATKMFAQLAEADLALATHVLANETMDVATAAKIISQLTPDQGAQLLSNLAKGPFLMVCTMPGGCVRYDNLQKAADILEAMKPEAAAKIIASDKMDVNTAALILSKMDSVKVAEIFNVATWLFIMTDTETTEGIVNILPMPPIPFSYIISKEKAAAILSNMTPDKAAEVLAVLANMPIAKCAEGAKCLGGSNGLQRAADILGAMIPQAAAKILASDKMDVKTAATILSKMSSVTVARIFEAGVIYKPILNGPPVPMNGYIISKEKAAAIVSLMTPDKAAEVLRYIATRTICNGDLCMMTVGIPANPQRAADILGAMSHVNAAKIIASDRIDVGTAVTILSLMKTSDIAAILISPTVPAEKAAAILSKMAPDKAAEVLISITNGFAYTHCVGGGECFGIIIGGNPQRAADILGAMTPQAAAKILASDKMDVKTAVVIFQKLLSTNKEAVTLILNELDAINPDKAQQIKAGLNQPWWEGMDVAGMISYLTNLAPAKAAAALTELSKADLDLAAQVLTGMDAQKAGLIIGSDAMSVETAVDLFMKLAPEKAASILQAGYYGNGTVVAYFVSTDKAAKILSSITVKDVSKAVAIFTALNNETAARILNNDNIDIATAVNILSKMSTQKVAEIFNAPLRIFWPIRRYETDTATTEDIEKMPPYFSNRTILSADKAAAILSAMSVDKAAEILTYMRPEVAARIIASDKMDAKSAAKILGQIDPQKVANILTSLDTSIRYILPGPPIYYISAYKAAAILSAMTPDKAAEVLSCIVNGWRIYRETAGVQPAAVVGEWILPIQGTQRAADILRVMTPRAAAKILASDKIDVKTCATILKQINNKFVVNQILAKLVPINPAKAKEIRELLRFSPVPIPIPKPIPIPMPTPRPIHHFNITSLSPIQDLAISTPVRGLLGFAPLVGDYLKR